MRESCDCHAWASLRAGSGLSASQTPLRCPIADAHFPESSGLLITGEWSTLSETFARCAHPTHGKAYQRESSVLLGSISLPVSSAMEHWSATRVRSTDPFIVSTVGVLPGPLFIRPCGRRTDILPFDRASRGNVDNPSPLLLVKTAPTEQPIRFPLLYLTCKRKLNWPLSRSSDFIPMSPW
jgi:hypothetical protein